MYRIPTRDSSVIEARDNAILVPGYVQLDYQLYNLPTVSKEDEEPHVLQCTYHGTIGKI